VFSQCAINEGIGMNEKVSFHFCNQFLAFPNKAERTETTTDSACESCPNLAGHVPDGNSPAAKEPG
jgi:hypothetical protein